MLFATQCEQMSFKEIAKLSASKLDSPELFDMDIPVLLMFVNFFRTIFDRTPLSGIHKVWLKEYYSNSIIGSISMDPNRDSGLKGSNETMCNTASLRSSNAC